MDDDEKDAKQIQEQLAALRFEQTLKQLSVLQDFADAAIAANDIRGNTFQILRCTYLCLRTLNQGKCLLRVFGAAADNASCVTGVQMDEGA